MSVTRADVEKYCISFFVITDGWQMSSTPRRTRPSASSSSTQR